MTTYRQIRLDEDGRILLEKARWCDDFSSKLRGFTFRRNLAEDDGLVLVEKSDSRINTSIHMLFVFFDLGVIWVNDSGHVVDKVLAKPRRLSYAPQAPARYVIELHPSLLDEIEIGEKIKFE
jgi:uncharacterized membrane protein (UPF0127 family)